MIHDLTAGHLDPRNVQGPVLNPIEMRVVRRLLAELAGKHDDGAPTLDGWKVSFEEGCIVLSWKGGKTNRTAEEFALRIQRETGRLIADREHGRIVEPGQLTGLGARNPAESA